MGRRLIKQLFFIAVAVVAFTPSLVSGQEIDQYNKDASKLALNLSVVDHDNYHPLFIDGIGATEYALTAGGRLVNRGESAWFQIDYSAKHRQFELDDDQWDVEDSYSEYTVAAQTRLFLSDKWALDLSALHGAYDERLGTGLTRFRKGIVNADHYVLNQANATFRYGSIVDGRVLKLDLEVKDTEYDDINSYNELFDLTMTQPRC